MRDLHQFLLDVYATNAKWYNESSCSSALAFIEDIEIEGRLVAFLAITRILWCRRWRMLVHNLPCTADTVLARAPSASRLKVADTRARSSTTLPWSWAQLAPVSASLGSRPPETTTQSILLTRHRAAWLGWFDIKNLDQSKKRMAARVSALIPNWKRPSRRQTS